MPAAPLPKERLHAGPIGFRVLRFATIGIGATFLYAGLSLFLEEVFDLSSIGASITGYAIAASFSYLGHKYFTFLSAGEHREEVPRFVVTVLTGLGIATIAPFFFTYFLGLASWVAIAFTCIVIPATNLVVLDRWVFSNQRAKDDRLVPDPS
jgi:putative flippase GtrA